MVESRRERELARNWQGYNGRLSQQKELVYSANLVSLIANYARKSRIETEAESEISSSVY